MKSIQRICSGLCLLAATIAPTSLADIQWQTFSLSYLQGDNYRVGDPERQVVTFEHAAATTWGDSFLFWDHLWFHNGMEVDYGEWSPRFSFCKLWQVCIAKPNSDAFIKDVLIATTLEKGETFTNGLVGVGVDINLPKFKYFTLNLYRRMAESKADNWQATVTWGLPFTFGNQAFLYDGFLDKFNATDNEAASMNWTMQLRWNLAKNWGAKNPLYLGVEYAYWENKFGIQDRPSFRTKETNANVLVKWHF